MRRREFIITLLGGAATWPLATHAQQTSNLPSVGFIGSDTPDPYAGLRVPLGLEIAPTGGATSRHRRGLRSPSGARRTNSGARDQTSRAVS
jgi:hypothetical protein